MRRRERLQDAIRVIGILKGDLITACRTFELFSLADTQRSFPPPVRAGMNRLAMGGLFLALCKVSEFYDCYHDLLADPIRHNLKEIRREIDRRNILRLRNEIVGHIHSKRSNRPLTHEEISKYLDDATGGDFEKFILWVNDPINDDNPETVVAKVEAAEIMLAAKLRLTAIEQ